MRLQRTRDGQLRLGVTIQHVDKLILLDGRDQTSTTFRIAREELTGDYATNTRFAECFEMQTVKFIGGRLVLEDGDAAGIGAHDDVVCEPPLLARFSSRQRVLDTLFHRPRRDALTLCRFQNITKLQRQKKKGQRNRGGEGTYL